VGMVGTAEEGWRRALFPQANRALNSGESPGGLRKGGKNLCRFRKKKGRGSKYCWSSLKRGRSYKHRMRSKIEGREHLRESLNFHGKLKSGFN